MGNNKPVKTCMVLFLHPDNNVSFLNLKHVEYIGPQKNQGTIIGLFVSHDYRENQSPLGDCVIIPNDRKPLRIEIDGYDLEKIPGQPGRVILNFRTKQNVNSEVENYVDS